MKKVKIIFLLFLLQLVVGCKSSYLKNVDPAFLNSAKIEIWSYPERNSWHYKDTVKHYHYSEDLKIEDGKLNIANNQNIKEIVVLNKDQIEIFYHDFYNSKICDGDVVSACYYPRHLIVFYNEKNEVVNALELCFECSQMKALNNFNYPSLCEDKIDLIIKDFKSFGINFFK